MKNIIATTVFIILAASAFGQNNVMLTVEVDSIQKLKGAIYAAVFKNQDDFKADRAVQRKKTVVKNSSENVVFNLPADRHYMVALFQDLNTDGKLNTKGAMNVPDEPVGFSNNKYGRFGPPGFDRISFLLKHDTTITIHIISSRREYFNKAN